MSTEVNARQVAQLYNTYLNREGSTEDINYWAAQLDAGKSLQDVTKEFTHSDEYKNDIKQDYFKYLARSGANNEIEYFADQGLSFNDLKQEFLGSDERRNRVQQEYQGLLGRTGDILELKYWANQDLGADEIDTKIRNSGEAVNRRIIEDSKVKYQQLLADQAASPPPVQTAVAPAPTVEPTPTPPVAVVQPTPSPVVPPDPTPKASTPAAPPESKPAPPPVVTSKGAISFLDSDDKTPIKATYERYDNENFHIFNDTLDLELDPAGQADTVDSLIIRKGSFSPGLILNVLEALKSVFGHYV